ncbi:ATP-binding protein [Thermoanaerobacterium sp. RBIITD]|uniref:ATP-binding protein n=1 Tax=Thermoanaerobacterium sp. RBIITD TaxID=1550240 RepID=UPI000BB952C1|nr:ATP-binding protein [Thermoanaerobacterium sp. RBIITD]SNX54292.1 Signal transduction histidine kinase, nitrogen specific [Thermoanaerobacterium sp. RBIITD]
MEEMTKSIENFEDIEGSWLYDLVNSSHEFIIIKNFKNDVIYINKFLLRFLGFYEDEVINNYNSFFNNVLLCDARKVGKNIFELNLNSKYGFDIKFKVIDNYLDDENGNKICIIEFLEFIKYTCKTTYDVNIYLNTLYKRFRIVDLIDTGIILLDKNKNIEYMNRAALKLVRTNYSNSFKRNINEIIKRLDSNIDIDEILNKGMMIYRVKDDGNEYHLSIEIANTYDDSLQCLILKDVTEKIKLGEIIEQSEKYNLMGGLAASLIHEIKNSITSIKGFLQLMQMKYKDNHTYFESMLNESDRIIDLTMSYLGVVKNSKSDDKIDLNDAIEKYMLLIDAEAIQRHVKIIKDLNNTPLIKMDYNQLKQILLNIFQNALQAIDKDGKIYLTTRFNSYINKVIIRIADNGCGIDKKDLKKVMMPLFTTKKDGTGLGLSVCKNILDTYGGNIKILSKKGVGTIVKIYLQPLKD